MHVGSKWRAKSEEMPDSQNYAHAQVGFSHYRQKGLLAAKSARSAYSCKSIAPRPLAGRLQRTPAMT